MEEVAGEPRGLCFHHDFITPEHEVDLIAIFRSTLLWPVRTRDVTTVHRRLCDLTAVRSEGADADDDATLGLARLSLHYGLHFDYKTMGVESATTLVPFPDWLVPLLPTTEADRPDQVCLQYYPPGAGIPPHCDTHSTFDRLYALSLGAPVEMEFRRLRSSESSHNIDRNPSLTVLDDKWEKRVVDLTPRSMMRMDGDSRYHWQHGIKKRKTDTVPLGDHTQQQQRRLRADRWSITYRWLRKPIGGAACDCGNVLFCDTAQEKAGIERAFRWKETASTTTTNDTTTAQCPQLGQ